MNLSSSSHCIVLSNKSKSKSRPSNGWRLAKASEEFERLRLPSNFPSDIIILFRQDIPTKVLDSDIFCQAHHHHSLRLERFYSSYSSPCHLSIMSARANIVLFVSFLTSVLAFQTGSLSSINVAPGRTASELYTWTLPIDTKAAFGTWYTELHPTFRQTTYEEYVSIKGC